MSLEMARMWRHRDRDRRPPSAGAEWRALEEAEPGS